MIWSVYRERLVAIFAYDNIWVEIISSASQRTNSRFLNFVKIWLKHCRKQTGILIYEFKVSNWKPATTQSLKSLLRKNCNSSNTCNSWNLQLNLHLHYLSVIGKKVVLLRILKPNLAESCNFSNQNMQISSPKPAIYNSKN